MPDSAKDRFIPQYGKYCQTKELAAATFAELVVSLAGFARLLRVRVRGTKLIVRITPVLALALRVGSLGLGNCESEKCDS
jgi:hypothetical protein